MGHSSLTRALRLGLAAFVLLDVMACASSSPLVGQVRRSLRNPGEHNSALPEEVWKKHDCGKKDLPYLHFESLEVAPERLKPGEEFNHRWVYSLCPETPTSVVEGTLETRIYFKGEPIVSEANNHFELKPGRWVIDTFVQVPPQAQAGVYSIEIAFQSKPTRFRKRRSFAVQ